MQTRYPLLESFGYIVSIFSTFLLALAAWEGADGRPTLRILIIGGALLAILGMILRWYVWWRRHGIRRKH